MGWMGDRDPSASVPLRSSKNVADFGHFLRFCIPFVAFTICLAHSLWGVGLGHVHKSKPSK